MNRREQQSGLDSLLDMMTNVVGILVVVLAVTQLNVTETIRSIRIRNENRPEVSPTELQLAEEEANRLKRALAELKSTWNGLGPDADTIHGQLVHIEALVKGLEEEAEARPRLSITRDTLTERIKESGRQITELMDKRTQLQRLRDRLKAQLGDIPDVSASLGYKPRLPNPRQAPDSVVVESFLCRYGRLTQLPEKELAENLVAATVEVLKNVGPNGIGLSRSELIRMSDMEILKRVTLMHSGDVIRIFNVKSKRRTGLYWQLESGILGPIAQLYWNREKVGETAQEVRGQTSWFRQWLRRHKSENKLNIFYVWGDSFEVYLEARAASDEEDYLGNWVPHRINEEFRISILGSLSGISKNPEFE